MNKNKNIVITGTTSGIGLACVKKFYADPNIHRIYCGARRTQAWNSLAQENFAGSEKVKFHRLDINDAESRQQFLDFVTADMKQSGENHIDCLINNAGGAHGLESLVDGKHEDWETMIQTNLLSTMKFTQPIAKIMIEQKHGHIINISSIAGRAFYEGGGMYCASKFGLNALTKTLKLELNDFGIRVSSIDPGLVKTEFSLVRFKGDEEKADKVYDGMKPLSPEDIADCVYFAASAPPHVNIDEILVTPTAQAWVHKVKRD